MSTRAIAIALIAGVSALFLIAQGALLTAAIRTDSGERAPSRFHQGLDGQALPGVGAAPTDKTRAGEARP